MTTFHFLRWLDALWCVLIALYVLMGLALVPLHGDEPTQIYMGRDFYYQFVLDAGEQVQFREWETLTGDEATQQELRLLNGTLPKYLFGMAAALNGYSVDAINQQWAWGAGWDWNHTNGHVPPDDLLLTARAFSAALLAVGAVALFWLGRALGGRAVGYLASAYFVLNPAVLVNGRRAMMEGALLAFSVLVMWVALWLLRTRSRWLYVLLGVVSGLAVASKHTAIVTVLAAFIVIAGDSLYRAWQERHSALAVRQISALFGAGLLSLLVFFALNPAWWSNPAGRINDVLRLRADLLAGQIEFFGGYESAGDQVRGFAEQALIVPRIYADSDFDGFISQQAERIAAYDRSLWAGISIGGSAIGAAFVALLALIGLAALRWHPQVSAQAGWLIAIWAALTLLLTLVLTPLAWQRYYLPLYPVLALLIALGADFVLRMIAARRTLSQTESA